MSVEIPPEYVEMGRTVRRFIEKELAPHENEVDRLDQASEELLAPLRKQAVALGIYGFNLPERMGGAGLPPLGDVVISEQMGRTSVAMAEAIGRLPHALSHADIHQVEWFVRPVVNGEAMVANALTEPGAGSDLGALTTRAVQHGASWQLDGFKHFICNAERSDHLLVLAVTDPGATLRDRFTVFIVDKDASGLQMVSRFDKMGWRGLPMNAFALDACEVPEDHVLGGVGNGFGVIMSSVNRMRLSIAARCVGSAGLLLELATDYARNRRASGRRLGDHQAIQFKLADMSMQYDAARLLVYAGAAEVEAGTPSARVSASKAKVFATEAACAIADETMQIFGGSGYMRDLPIERLFRDLRGFRIGEGTSEIQRIQIGRHLVGAER